MANRIIFDVDGCLADFLLGYTKQAREMGYNIPLYGTRSELYTTWDPTYLTQAQTNVVWEKIKSDIWWWTELEPLWDAQTYRRIDELQRVHDVYFVTSRVGSRPKAQTEVWLERRGILNPTVIISGLKGEIAAGIKATHLIDDKAGNCLYTSYHSRGTKVFILDNRSNRFDGSVAGARVTRVSDINQFLEVCEQ